MSMGYGANFADTIKEEFIKKSCPKEYKKFIGLLKKFKVSLDDYAQILCEEIELENLSEKDLEKIGKAYDVLIDTFNRQFKNVGLCLSFHSVENNGDCYDDVNGAYWEVTEAYQLSPGGRMIKEQLCRSFFVTYG